MASWFVDQGFSDGTGGSVAPPGMPGQFASTWQPGGPTGFAPGDIVRQTNSDPSLGAYSDYGMKGSTVPGLVNGGYTGLGPGGQNTLPGATTNASGGGDLTSQVVALANQVGRPDIAENPQYWVDVAASKGQGPGGANGPLDTGYFGNLMRNANGGIGGSSSASGGGPAFGSFTAPFTGTFTPPVTNFQAPTGTDDPGFKFALQQGTDALQRSAAAKGNLLTGGTAKDLASYTTGAALQDYAGAYNRALSTAQFNNNTAANAFGTNYGIFRDNQTIPFGMLYNTTQLGLNAANNSNASLGAYGANVGNLSGNYGNQLTNLTTGTGNANAAATVNNGNNTNAAIGSLGNWFQQYNPYGTGMGAGLSY